LNEASVPVCLFCGTPHTGLPVCANGKVVCCMCWEFTDISDLNVCADGRKEDVCRTCARAEQDHIATLPFDRRLRAHYRSGMRYTDLEARVYPPDHFKRYWNYSQNGGPPGGRMSFTAALTRRGLRLYHDRLGDRRISGELPPGRPAEKPNRIQNGDR